ncbi:N-acetylmuramic acid 6-phosphate etherase [bacterium]|nr:N-acetylmuramic acid 6-phosphate etherase [FCB group bacterium]MBL7191331.1 N-acetylmuramic acid 6-phosphate etherase [bacterium]
MSKSEHKRLLNHTDINPDTKNFSGMSIIDMLSAMNREDANLSKILESAIPAVGRAVEIVTRCLAMGGRLVFVGEGTAGRLGVLEAVSCRTIFNTPDNLVMGIIAGGESALTNNINHASEDSKSALNIIDDLDIDGDDAVCGIMIYPPCPFLKTALLRAKELEASTVLISRGYVSKDLKPDALINFDTGPEVIAGAFELKAASAIKMILNMISTASMALLGKLYGNLMVDLNPVSEDDKLRAVRVLSLALNIEEPEAEKLLHTTEWDLKAAIYMKSLNIDYRTALDTLADNHGKVSL